MSKGIGMMIKKAQKMNHVTFGLSQILKIVSK